MPAVYNRNRLNERPLPEPLEQPLTEDEASDDEFFDLQFGNVSIVQQENVVDVEMSEALNTSLNMFEHDSAATAATTAVADNTVSTAVFVDVNAATAPIDNDNVDTRAISSQDAATGETQVKQEMVPVYQPLSTNNMALDGLLNAPSQAELMVEILDDMEITLIKGQIYKPLEVTDRNLIKREMDVVSGDLPFTAKVSFKKFSCRLWVSLVKINIIFRKLDESTASAKKSMKYRRILLILSRIGTRVHSKNMTVNTICVSSILFCLCSSNQKTCQHTTFPKLL